MFALIVCWLKSLIVTHCSAFMNVVGSIRIVLGTGCYCVGVLVIGLVLAGGTVVGQTPDSKSTNGTAASDGGLDRLITKLYWTAFRIRLLKLKNGACKKNGLTVLNASETG